MMYYSICSSFSQGEFGVVYKGYLKREVNDSAGDTVAVKTLKGQSGHFQCNYECIQGRIQVFLVRLQNHIAIAK